MFCFFLGNDDVQFPWLFTGHFGGRCCDRKERHLEQKGHHMHQDMVEYYGIFLDWNTIS